jgi:hypothetical protein
MTGWAAQLTKREHELVTGCLAATVRGDFFPDWEFETLFGVSRSTVERVMTAWPAVDPQDEDVGASVAGALNHLLGYPHGRYKELAEYTSASPDEIRRTLDRLLELGF